MSTELIKSENIQSIAELAPNALLSNQTSVQKCNSFGTTLLAKAENMNDEVDTEISNYLHRVGETLKVMNERRSPVTKLFDQVRSCFTSLEKEIDIKSPGTVAYQLQLKRNEYARMKLQKQEEERKRQERVLKVNQAKADYKAAIEVEFSEYLNRYITHSINELNRLNTSVTLENFEDVSAQIKNFPTQCSPELFSKYVSNEMLPILLDLNTVKSIQKEIIESKRKAFEEQFSFEMEGNISNIVRLLPSKQMELREIDELRKVNAAAAAEREKELKLKEKEERVRQEEIRRKEQERQKQEIEVKKQQESMNTLFDTTAANISAPVKASVKKKIEVLHPAGFLNIFNMWWINEGQTLPIDELEKKFKSQITFCEKMANKGEEISSEYIRYVDDVKAK